MAKYDLAISFAGEQRKLARNLAERLDAAGYSIFFDEFYEAALWGRDLSVALADVYAHEARYCLLLVSADYVRKPWTNLERQSAIFRFMNERNEYLLCLRLDETHLPGMPQVIGYLDYQGRTEEEIHGLLLQKLGLPAHDDFISSLHEKDRELATNIIRACYRRAIFTRMDSEIDLYSMYSSIREAIGQVQRIVPDITDPRLQYAAMKIIGSLDEIERVRNLSRARVSNHLEPELAHKIDENKRQVIRLMLEIRRAAALSIQLPMSLQMDHFFGLEAAREPPRAHI